MRRAVAFVCVLAVAAAGLGFLLLRPGGAPERCLAQLIPAYFAPGPAWDALLEDAPAGRATIVVNPASGPGLERDPAYARVIAAARERDLALAGYVHTLFGARPAAEVEADAARYREWYGIDGVFLDEAGADLAALPYYQALHDALRASGAGPVFLNPGRPPDEGYMAVADVIVTFEGTAQDHAVAAGADWMRGHGAERFAHLVHATAVGDAPRVERTAAERGVGHAYATDDVVPNPWDALPAGYAASAAQAEGCVELA